MKDTLTKRIFGVGLSAVMLLSSVSVASADNYGISTYGTVYHTNQKFDIANTSCREAILKCNGSADYDNFAPAQVSWTNPANEALYQAYCINPAYPGYGDVADYGIDIERFDNSCIVDAGGSGGSGKTAGSKSSAGNTIAAFLEGAVNYGYPSVSAETLLGGTASDYGVSQNQMEYAAYLATKMAIWSGIHNNYGINTWSENTGATQYPHALRVKVLAATKAIYNAAGSYTPHDGQSTVSLTAGTPTLSGSNYETAFTIANTDNNVDGSDMYVEMAAGGTFMDGLMICDEDGKEYPTTKTSSGTERYILPDGTTEFKAILPDPGDAGATVELRLYAQQKSKILLYGRSTSSGAQNYVLAGNFYDNPTASFVIGDTGIVEDPEEPTTPDTGTGELTVIKLDARDNATPLAGVTFDCYNAKGQLIDTGTTDSNGKWIPEISGSGTYTIIERDSGNSYQLTEPTSMVITVQDDKKATATFRDYPSQTVTMEKEDATTGKPIPGVEYEIVQIDGDGAWRATGKTDSNGKIAWEDVPDGTYLVREVSTVEGYILDSTPQYVTVKNGQAPSLKFLNSKFPGLTILKVDKQTDTVVTNKNGIAISKTLPLGRYIIRETKAPDFYGANTQDIQTEIEYVGQIVRLEVYNSSLYTNVAVNKKGYTQVAPGQSIRYEFMGIKNNSTVSLNSFYWRDTLPVEAVRLDKIITGTWNQRLSYKIVYKTNLHDYRTLADNLDTSKNNVILASPEALGLPSNEYVTEIMFVFGTVKSGFAQVETPYIYCNVLPTVTHEQRFTNSTDVGGLHQGQWIMSNDRWVTVVYGKQEVQKLPRTGY